MDSNFPYNNFQAREETDLFVRNGSMANTRNEPAVEDAAAKRKRRRTQENASSSQGNGKQAKHDRPWSESIHRSFVEAIYDIGVKNASPAVIMEHMSMVDDSITSERVKSHLQKYRNNKEKSKQEFFAEFDAWMQKALTVGAASDGESTNLASPAAIMSMMGNGSFLGGEMASFLSYAAMYEDQNESNGCSERATTQNVGEYFSSIASTGASVPFPVLTEEERKSPLGMSISHVIGLFYSVSKCIMQQRAAQEQLSAAGESLSETNHDLLPHDD
ncbi:hypothetical protein FisN_12Lh317 [Fistulifera solaris]|jgi:SHAQKYF class myb-like DNA-binding protein|uniref:HTH myb-type domain-containing protein n=1 Tax=Fistulifera solaris TaxID=1519565 RepID=A0A1Z5JMH6_FISSO|nr:hypothetical protein FisN_12Lh317 [Fistulifera solaris]|eukprot:GAX14988.1 hypothetical protein FisN_12Lh317 [Fistulifera solaris]